MVSPLRSSHAFTGAEAVVRLLEDHGVTHIFGLCGDTRPPFYDALHRLDHGITHILARDERSAAHMADGYARVTGKVGVCEGPSGGATYILPGLVEANESSIPVLAITTDIAVSSRGGYALTELDQGALVKPVTKWNAVLNGGGEIPGAWRATFRAMTTGCPGSAHIALPIDVQKQPVDPDAIQCEPIHGRFPAARAAPHPQAIATLAEALLSAADPLMVCDGGPVIARAERAVQTLVEAAAMILFIGCRAGSVTTKRRRVPKAGSRIPHIDRDPTVIGANDRTEAAVVADAKLVPEAFVSELGERRRVGADRRATGAVDIISQPLQDAAAPVSEWIA